MRRKLNFSVGVHAVPSLRMMYVGMFRYCLKAILNVGNSSSTKRIRLEARSLNDLRPAVLQAFGLRSTTELTFAYTDGEDPHSSTFRPSAHCNHVFFGFSHKFGHVQLSPLCCIKFRIRVVIVCVCTYVFLCNSTNNCFQTLLHKCAALLLRT